MSLSFFFQLAVFVVLSCGPWKVADAFSQEDTLQHVLDTAHESCFSELNKAVRCLIPNTLTQEPTRAQKKQALRVFQEVQDVSHDPRTPKDVPDSDFSTPAPVKIAAYNIRNYFTPQTHSSAGGVFDNRFMKPKSEAEKQAVVAVIKRMQPDILGIMEIGSLADLQDLLLRLKQQGCEYPQFEWLEGADTERHVALLSRFPIQSHQSQNQVFLSIDGHRYRMARGILDVTIQVHPNYSLRILGVHWKSKHVAQDGDADEIRLKEALYLRRYVQRLLTQDPHMNLLIFGDFNATPQEPPIHEILKCEAGQTFIAQSLKKMPAVQDHVGKKVAGLRPLVLQDTRGETWTHYWKSADTYARFDYFLISSGLWPEIIKSLSGIEDEIGWNKASDHRAIFTQVIPDEKKR